MSQHKPQFVIKWVDFQGVTECSMACSFASYESFRGCRIGASDGWRHPTDKCPGEGVYELRKVDNSARG